jgi:hypothetical protein
MNRMLAIPAGCCLVAYAVLFTNLQGAPAESAVSAAPSPAAVSPSGAYVPSAAPLLSRADAEKMLETLKDDYLRPYRTWEESPHRIMSRAAVRRVEPSSAHYVLATNQPGDHELLATIVVKFGSRAPETFPCVIDRVTKGVGVFAGGQWTQADAWLKAAPAPLLR